jgi:subtilase family serine protease
MSLVGVRTLCARAAVLVLSAPLLLGASAPVASVGHAMTPASESASQVDFFPDSETDAIRLPLCLNAIPLGCFRPETIRAAFGIKPVLDQGITGKGVTIVVIGAFRQPALESDLAMFDNAWTQPQAPSPPVAGKPRVITMDGTPPFDPNPKGVQFPFSLEQSIDVEWAHAIAPDASIVVVEAKSEQDVDLVAATKYAVDHNLGDIISQSFGEAEMCAAPAVLEEQHAVFQKASELGMTIFASSGDQGAARHACDGPGFVLSASTPASDPLVTAVGGTHLVAGKDGVYQTETAWNIPDKAASGGGFSTLFRRPGWQAPFQKDNKARGVPDVAYAAESFVAFWNTHGVVVAGTSAGPPQWAGIIALADQAAGHRLGSINKTLYHIGKSDAYSTAFNDITSGNNSIMGIAGFEAAPGWDAVTGLGTPQVANLIPLLVDGQG